MKKTADPSEQPAAPRWTSALVRWVRRALGIEPRPTRQQQQEAVAAAHRRVRAARLALGTAFRLGTQQQPDARRTRDGTILYVVRPYTDDHAGAYEVDATYRALAPLMDEYRAAIEAREALAHVDPQSVVAVMAAARRLLGPPKSEQTHLEPTR